MRSWWNKERVLNGFESLMDLYEIENSMVGNHLEFDFNLVEGLANKSSGISFFFVEPLIILVVVPKE